jgi:hypothetical protein
MIARQVQTLGSVPAVETVRPVARDFAATSIDTPGMSKNPSRSPDLRGNRQTIIADVHPKRAEWANNELSGLVRRFGLGEIRSVIHITAWADGGEPGAGYHIETAKDKQILIAQMEKLLVVLRNLKVSRGGRR